MNPIEAVKEVAKLAHDYGKTELYEKIVALREQILEMSEEKHNLTVENQQLRAKLETRKDMVFRNGMYHVEGDETPFCKVCFEVDGISTHLRQVESSGWDTGRLWFCDNCKTSLPLMT